MSATRRSRLARPLALVLAAACVPVFALAAPAAADSPGCVTGNEALRVIHTWYATQDGVLGIRRGRVERIFDTHGKTLARQAGALMKRYPMCPRAPYKKVVIIYLAHGGAWHVAGFSTI